MLSLDKDIENWDGKSADDIALVFESHHKAPGFVRDLIRLAKQADLQTGATWLLKAWFEADNRCSAMQCKQIYGLLDKLGPWEAKLHILQCMPYMPVAEASKDHVEFFLRTTLSDSNKFVRAWTYNGWHLLAEQFPEYKKEVDQFFEMAMRDEAASVKARIRNIKRS
ncbi:MAG: hypothetical protein MI746_15625 [Pseudomonadales bacterium]|nr:hypothetical protein [Pseudomonadales bacterium]